MFTQLIGLAILALAIVLNRRIKNMAGELERLTTEVAETRGVVASAIALIKGFKQALDEAIAANDPAALTALSDSLDAGQQELAQAIAENPLPGEPPPPTE